MKKCTRNPKSDPITTFTLEIWYSIVRRYKIQKDINVLRWIAYDSNFTPNKYDTGFKRWETKGITAWCVLMKDGQLESFQEMKEKYDR